MIQVEHGRMYIRRLRGDESAIVGVIAVPSEMEVERIHVARLGEYGMQVAEASREVSHRFHGAMNVSTHSINEILMQPIFHPGAEPDVFEVFLRNTTLPGAPEGFKWVIAAGASKAHDGQTRMVTIEKGLVVMEEGEVIAGSNVEGVLRQKALWGPEPHYALSHTLDPASYKDWVKGDRERHSASDPQFMEFLRRMSKSIPEKDYYTESELAERSAEAGRIMREMMSQEEPAASCQVYMLGEGSSLAGLIASGSAVVMSPWEDGFKLYYEGDIYKGGMDFAEKAKHAYGRMVENYPPLLAAALARWVPSIMDRSTAS